MGYHGGRRTRTVTDNGLGRRKEGVLGQGLFGLVSTTAWDGICQLRTPLRVRSERMYLIPCVLCALCDARRYEPRNQLDNNLSNGTGAHLPIITLYNLPLHRCIVMACAHGGRMVSDTSIISLGMFLRRWRRVRGGRISPTQSHPSSPLRHPEAATLLQVYFVHAAQLLRT